MMIKVSPKCPILPYLSQSDVEVPAIQNHGSSPGDGHKRDKRLWKANISYEEALVKRLIWVYIFYLEPDWLSFKNQKMALGHPL